MKNEEKVAMSLLYADMASNEIYYTAKDMWDIRTHIGSILQPYGLSGETLRLLRDDVVVSINGRDDAPESPEACITYGALCMAARVWGVTPPVEDDGIAEELSELYRSAIV